MTLLCYCSNCPNNTCQVENTGLCWSQWTLGKSDAIERHSNCFSPYFSLISNFICDENNDMKAGQSIVRCCNSADYCNQPDDFLPPLEEARPHLQSLTSEPRSPRSTTTIDSMIAEYSAIPQGWKIAFIVSFTLTLVIVLTFSINCFIKWKRRQRDEQDLASDSESGKASSYSAAGNNPACDTPLMAQNEQSVNNSILASSHISSIEHKCRKPWMGERHLESASLPGFQMSLASADPRLNIGEASSGSGAGQPYLTQRSIANDIRLVDVVGRGYYGVVWRGEYKGESVAVKIFSSAALASWERESEIYQTTMLRHKNILGFIAIDRRVESAITGYWLVTDYYPLGSLYDFLKQNSLAIQDAVRMAFAIASGLSHLHTEIYGIQGKPAIAHRDLKSKNILVKTDGTCCIGDLGMAVRYNSASGAVDIPATTRAGTNRYLAPEILDNKLNLLDFESVKATDVYSMGLIFWEVLRRTCYSLPDGSPASNLFSENEENERAGYNSKENSPRALSEAYDLSVCGHEQFKSSNDEITNELALVCDTYEHPYQGYVSPDPTLNEMRDVVCMKKIRPPLSSRWAKFAPMRDISTLMRECWYDKPQSRLTALRIRKSLNELSRLYFNLNLQYD